MSSAQGGTPRIFVAGHRGMVGSAIVRVLERTGGCEIVTRGREDLDLQEQEQVRAFFRETRIDQVYLAAALVGGIHANSAYPADFIRQNLMIQLNVVHEAWAAGIRRLLMLGSSCIYPKAAPQPMTEECLLTGRLEPTNEPYAIAKIAGIKLCESYNRQYGTDYRSIMPTNLYGPGDNYHPDNSHVIPALIRRFHKAKEERAPSVHVWGSGTPRREFLFVEDMAEACIFLMGLDTATYQTETSMMCSHINAGSGEDITIRELAEITAKVVGYQGRIEFDPLRPDGTPRKLMDSSRLRRLGWVPRTQFEDGMVRTYADFLAGPADSGAPSA